jgi:hypothetical protein
MANNELLIKINADAKNAKKAFDDIRDQTSELEGQLKNVATISAVAFAAFTAEIFFSVKAFEEAEQASRQLTNALQNQGIFTEALKKSYAGFADAVQDKTGIDNDAIIAAQATAQAFLGQTEITKGLTFAIADLGTKMGGDLNGAAEKIARTIGTGTNAFARQGLVIREGATEAERMAAVLEHVQIQAGGLAAEMDKANGFSTRLATSFGNFQEKIGAAFAPAIAAARLALSNFFDTLGRNPILMDLVIAGIAAGAAVTGIIAAITAAIPAFLALKAAVVAFGIASNVALAGIPILIFTIVAAITLLVLNWDKAMAGMSAAAKAAVTLISELFGGLGQVLSGALTLDTSKIKAGLEQIKDSFGKAKETAVSTYQEITAAQAGEGEKQNTQKKALADREAAQERQHQANLAAIRKAQIDLLKMQNDNASAETIRLKQAEIETLKALDQDKSAEELALLQERHAEIKALQDEQRIEDAEREAAFRQLQAETKAELDAQGIEVDAQIRADRLAQIQATAQTEADVDRKLQEDILNRRIAARNTELLDRKKYGDAYAKINKFINSEEVQGVKSAAGELVQLQQSKNATLKSIGKAAAIANITIGTAESALNIYKGFSTIPIIGPALGVAGAAAAIAFGAEKLATVNAAQDGGLVEGGIPGRDSVPFLLEPGELVVPKRNFNDVVGAVSGGSQDQSQMLALLQSIDDKISTPQTTIIQGDVMAEDSFIDGLVRKISDAVQHRNGQIYGVTS